MGRFILKLFTFGLIVIVLLSTLGVIVDAGLKKNKENEYCEIYNDNINADLLICGSSRALVHFSPRIIDSVFNINSYNIGLDGQPFLMQIAKYNFYRKYNCKPKYIIYAVDDLSLTKKEDLYGIDLYLPFLNDNALTQTLQIHNGFSIIDYHNPFTKYTYKWENIKWGIYLFFDIKKTEPNPQKEKGYQGMSRNWDDSFENFKKQYPYGFAQIYNKEVLEAFTQFVKIQKEEKIKIIFVWAPQYSEYTKMLLNKNEALDFYTNLSTKNDIPFLDYTNDTICNNKNYFYNSQHLNKEGSELFTITLVNDLKKSSFIE